MKKSFILAGLAGALMLGSTMTAMAAGEPSLYGQPLTEDYKNVNDDGKVLLRQYQVIIPGAGESIPASALTFADGWTGNSGNDVCYTDDWYEQSYTPCSFDMKDASGAEQAITRIVFWRIPAGEEGNVPADMKKFILNTSNQTQAQATDLGHWESNEKGWWIQYNDGHYLTNSWWQSPASGLWYYMGADGYMVTNTVIDGYTINADGAWVR